MLTPVQGDLCTTKYLTYGRLRYAYLVPRHAQFLSLSISPSFLMTFEIICRGKWTWADIGPPGVLDMAGDTRSSWANEKGKKGRRYETNLDIPPRSWTSWTRQ